jgi:Fur family ferric uptake transcriptional regulator
MVTAVTFEAFLKTKGLKITHERLDLLEGVLKRKGHFSIETLLYQLKDEGYEVSRDTVYRNIPLLLEAGVIRQSFRTGRETLYELAQGKPHHDHMLCRACGRVEEFVEPKIEALQEEVAKKKGFLLEHHCHQLVGLCRACHTA